MLKLLSKVKGTEKLIETFKNGFNESLRELLFEISALKNFIYEVNSDIINCVKIHTDNKFKFSEIEYGLLNMPFLDSVNKIKYIFKCNLKILSQFINSNYNDNFLFSDNLLNEISTEDKNDFEMTFDKSSLNNINKNQENYQRENNLIFDLE